MESLKINEDVPNCTLHEVELDALRLNIGVTIDKKEMQSYSFRIVFPEQVEGKYHPIEYAAQLLAQEYDRTKGTEQDYIAWLMAMMFFYDPEPRLDERRTRGFSLEKLYYSPTFQRTIRARARKGSKPADTVKWLAGKTTLSTSDLIARAIFARPDVSIPLSWDDYEDFRNSVLNDILSAQPEVESVINEELAKLRGIIESDKDLSPEERAGRFKRIRGLESNGFKMTIPYLLRAAWEEEEESASQFVDIVAKAHQLLCNVIREGDADSASISEDIDDAALKEHRVLIRTRLDVTAVNDLFDRTIIRYQEVYGIAPKADVKPTEQEQKPELEQYVTIREARQSDDSLHKWDVLVWIATQLANRNECIRLMLREAEDVFFELVEYVYSQIYLKIRKHLTPIERRAFKLMYFRLPIFGGRIAIHESVIRSFISGMDSETAAMAFLVLALKVTQLDNTDLAAELERRWRAYLRLYPYWLQITRDDESEEKRETLYKSRKLTLSEDEISLDDHPDDLWEAIIPVSPERIKKWAEEVCSPTEVRRLYALFFDGKTETEIARAEGVSQQAVNKSILKALERLRELFQEKDYRMNGKRVVMRLFGFRAE